MPRVLTRAKPRSRVLARYVARPTIPFVSVCRKSVTRAHGDCIRLAFFQGTREKIEEFLKTGKIEKLEEKRAALG